MGQRSELIHTYFEASFKQCLYELSLPITIIKERKGGGGRVRGGQERVRGGRRGFKEKVEVVRL